MREHNDTRARVQGLGGLLEGSQRGVALEALRESSSSSAAKGVVAQTASTWERQVMNSVDGH